MVIIPGFSSTYLFPFFYCVKKRKGFPQVVGIYPLCRTPLVLIYIDSEFARVFALDSDVNGSGEGVLIAELEA